MIAPMKKIYIILQDKDVVPALERLRDFGAVHIEHVRKPENEKAGELIEKLKTSAQAISILSQIKEKKTAEAETPQALASEDIVERAGEIARLKEDMAKRQALISQWLPWGAFDPEEIEELEAEGVFVRLFEVNENEQPDIPENAVFKELSKQGKMTRYIAVSLAPLALSLEPVALPGSGLKDLLNSQRQDSERIGECEKALEHAAGYINDLRQSRKVIEEELAFHQAFAGRGEVKELAYFKGFCPEDKCLILKGEAEKNQWAILVEDPADEDDVPTLLRNPKWVELINPVFDLINVLPGYKEVDISVIFLFFFSIFFGMLIGDAGYGLVFGLITLCAQIKMGKKVEDKTPFVLMYILSFMAISWGALTGIYFGQKWIAP